MTQQGTGPTEERLIPAQPQDGTTALLAQILRELAAVRANGDKFAQELAALRLQIGGLTGPETLAESVRSLEKDAKALKTAIETIQEDVEALKTAPGKTVIRWTETILLAVLVAVFLGAGQLAIGALGGHAATSAAVIAPAAVPQPRHGPHP